MIINKPAPRDLFKNSKSPKLKEFISVQTINRNNSSLKIFFYKSVVRNWK